MPSTLTFGIEIYFLLAYLPDDIEPPDPSEKRILYFDYTQESVDEYHDFLADSPSTRDDGERGGRLMSAINQTRDALCGVGLRVVEGKTDFSGWRVAEDTGIDTPEDTPYSYFQIKFRSPAFFFTPEALQEVKLALQTLTERFCLSTGQNSGLYVHVGDGDKSFDFETTRRLAAFIWAFEPQLHSIHPQYRQSSYHARELRGTSVYATGYRNKYDRTPDGIMGALDLLKCEDMESLGSQIRDNYGFLKDSQVNFEGVLLAARNADYPKKTIEWRQHKGTLDGDEICTWISTVVGIMYFVRDTPVEYFHGVLSFALEERWQKLGDGMDDEREEKYGPILAESQFTIDKLLRLLMLDDEADCYRDKWHVLTKAPLFPPHKSRITWDYEQERVPESADYVQCQTLRQIWEDLRILRDMPGSNLVFDPDHTINSSELSRQKQEQEYYSNNNSLVDEDNRIQALDRQITEFEESDAMEEEDLDELERQIQVLQQEHAMKHLPLGDEEWREYLMIASGWKTRPGGVSDPFAVGVERVRNDDEEDNEEASPKTVSAGIYQRDEDRG
ncbi:uncharacterized protein RSE6_11279 [Rhynchosporium secalis]|uniref:Uncharacterized protein n=1 Tax=Rhynchosporium secalis TaxID=38038 RepID=A0A1E1MMK8_RHYSE|nr:uncharacterized protein RSE6_11279 [Rhynchosporium secalis]